MYDPKTGDVKHGLPGSSLNETELKYCMRLGDWWSAKTQEEEARMSKAIVVQIGGEGASISTSNAGGGRRQHRLIQDASPDASPKGFFDCTVEVSLWSLSANTFN